MPNQHHPDKQAVTYRLHRDLVAEVKAEARRRGETVVDLVIRALRRELRDTSGTEISDALCREAVRRHRAYDAASNNPDTPLSVRLTLQSEIHGLRVALCIVHGWPSEGEADKEGKAYDLVIAWWQRHHRDEWADELDDDYGAIEDFATWQSIWRRHDELESTRPAAAAE